MTTDATRPARGSATPTAVEARSPDLPSCRLVAAVHAVDGIQFIAVADCRDALVQRLAAYVRRKLATQLWPADAARVRRLLDVGEPDAAVALYFDRVGQRWDEEWLVTAHVDHHPGHHLDRRLDDEALAPVA